jgi:hypothetical protein
VTDVNDLNLDARLDATITEMIYVPDNVADGSYLLNLQIASLKMMQVLVNPFCTLFNKDFEEMNLETYYDYCQKKRRTFSFDEDALVFKVGGKIYALSHQCIGKKGEPAVNLKCDPERAQELRAI